MIPRLVLSLAQKAAAFACGLLLITEVAYPTSRVGNGGRVANDELGFEVQLPSGVLSAQSTRDGQLAFMYAYRGPMMASTAMVPGFQPFVIFGDMVKAYPELSNAGEREVRNWVDRSTSQWVEVPTNSCAMAYKAKSANSITGFIAFGRGRGIIVAGSLLPDSADIIEQLLRTLRIRGGCSW